MAEAGKSLEEIATAARLINEKTVSIGTSLDTCTVPGSSKEERIPTGKAELGLGIHGEPGAEQIDFVDARTTTAILLDRLRPHMQKGPCVALLNNLGATSPLEMSVLAQALSQEKSISHVIGPAAMMTSLDMHGFSISVLPASDDELIALGTAVPINAWPAMQEITTVQVTPLPDGLSPASAAPSSNDQHRALITRVADVLITAESELNELDAKSGDGDTGSTLATAATALKNNVDRLPLDDVASLLPALGNELGQIMGGSSGVIMAIFFNAAGDACNNGSELTEALQQGLKRVSEVGGAVAGDRTMIDALAPALDNLPDGIAAASAAARQGAESTATMLQAKAGRAAYVPAENLQGNKDPGAHAVALVFECLETALVDGAA